MMQSDRQYYQKIVCLSILNGSTNATSLGQWDYVFEQPMADGKNVIFAVEHTHSCGPFQTLSEKSESSKDTERKWRKVHNLIQDL